MAYHSDVGLYNAQKLQLLHDEISAASAESRSYFSHVDDVLRDQRALVQDNLEAFQAEFRRDSLDARATATTQIQGLAGLQTRQQQFGKALTVGNEKLVELRADVQSVRAMVNDKGRQATIQCEASMTEVREGIFEATTNSASAQIEAVERAEAQVMQELHSISDRLDAIPSMASEQLSTLQNLVAMMNSLQIRMVTERQNLPNNRLSEAFPIINDKSNDMEMTYDSAIEEPIARICHFASMITTHKYSKDAQLVIEDIGRLLGMVMQQLSATSPSRDELPRKRKFVGDHQYSEFETAVQSMEDLAKAKRALTSSQRVQISNQGRYSDSC